MKIALVGNSHLSKVYTAALFKIGNKISIFDSKEIFGQSNNKQNLNFNEPYIFDEIEKGIKEKKITRVNGFMNIEKYKIVWLCQDVYVDAGGNAKIKDIFQIALSLVNKMKANQILVISSQIPAGSVAKIEKILSKRFPNKNVKIVYQPENLQVGDSLNSILNAKYFVIGAEEKKIQNIFKTMFKQTKIQLLFTSNVNAELFKHILNSHLALNVAFANEIGEIAEVLNANSYEIAKLLRNDDRIGKKAYLFPGPSFAGKTLARDLTYINRIRKKHGFNLPIITSITASNSMQYIKLLKNVKSYLKRRHSVGFAGISYKEFSSITAGSHFEKLLKDLSLKELGLKKLYFYDPYVIEIEHKKVFRVNSYRELLDKCQVIYVTRPNSAFYSVLSSYISMNRKVIHNVSGIEINFKKINNIEIKNFGSSKHE